MVNNNIIKPNNSFKEKVDNFGIDPNENAFKRALRNNNNANLKKEEEKYNLITNLPVKPYNNTYPNMKINLSNIKKEEYSKSDSGNNVIFDADTEKYLNNGIMPTEGYSMKASSVKEYGYAQNQNPRYRSYMEDFPKIVDKFMGDKNKGVFAIFDGHGGDEVAQMAKERFCDLFSYYLYNSKSNIEQSYQNAFRKIDEEISKGNYSENTGSTACVAYICQDNNLISGAQRFIYTANLGDTRAVLVSKNSCKRLTVDHKCADREEEKRIRSAGGVLIDGRIFGQLILSRALGDFAFKKYGISCVPYIQKHLITENDLYLVLASDGVWDVIQDNDLPNLIKEKGNTGIGKVAEHVVNSAMERGSQDNISCLVLKLN